jgi:hypothetical protein
MTSAVSEQTTDAKIVGDALVVSFMNAEPPKVWRAEMAHVSSAALELQETDGVSRLVMKRDGDVETVAGFSGRAQATQALMAITQALMAVPAGAVGVNGAASRPSVLGRFVRFVLKVIVAIIVIFILLRLIFSVVHPVSTASMLTEARSGVASQQGVPLQAGDFFKDK